MRGSCQGARSSFRLWARGGRPTRVDQAIRRSGEQAPLRTRLESNGLDRVDSSHGQRHFVWVDVAGRLHRLRGQLGRSAVRLDNLGEVEVGSASEEVTFRLTPASARLLADLDGSLGRAGRGSCHVRLHRRLAGQPSAGCPSLSSRTSRRCPTGSRAARRDASSSLTQECCSARCGCAADVMSIQMDLRTE